MNTFAHDVDAGNFEEVVIAGSHEVPEAEVRAFLDRLAPTPAEQLRMRTAAHRQGGELDTALRLLGEASQLESDSEPVRLDAVEVLVELGRMQWVSTAANLPACFTEFARPGQDQGRIPLPWFSWSMSADQRVIGL